jgi:hypothetical protein
MIEKVIPKVVKKLSEKYKVPEEKVWEVAIEAIEELKSA